MEKFFYFLLIMAIISKIIIHNNIPSNLHVVIINGYGHAINCYKGAVEPPAKTAINSINTPIHGMLYYLLPGLSIDVFNDLLA